MPTILTLGGVRVVIYPNDHRPAHVHVRSGSDSAVFNLNCPAGPVELRENRGFSHSQLTKLAKQLTAYLTGLCFTWSELHGHY